eukprot:6490357-Amphidinium_carterae.2
MKKQLMYLVLNCFQVIVESKWFFSAKIYGCAVAGYPKFAFKGRVVSSTAGRSVGTVACKHKDVCCHTTTTARANA